MFFVLPMPWSPSMIPRGSSRENRRSLEAALSAIFGFQLTWCKISPFLEWIRIKICGKNSLPTSLQGTFRSLSIPLTSVPPTCENMSRSNPDDHAHQVSTLHQPDLFYWSSLPSFHEILPLEASCRRFESISICLRWFFSLVSLMSFMYIGSR